MVVAVLTDLWWSLAREQSHTDLFESLDMKSKH